MNYINSRNSDLFADIVPWQGDIVAANFSCSAPQPLLQLSYLKHHPNIFGRCIAQGDIYFYQLMLQANAHGLVQPDAITVRR